MTSSRNKNKSRSRSNRTKRTSEAAATECSPNTAANTNTVRSPLHGTQPEKKKKVILHASSSSSTLCDQHLSSSFKELTTRRRFRVIAALIAVALFCDIFLAKPMLNQAGMTEVQLLNEIFTGTKTGVISNLEHTFRFINASIPSGAGIGMGMGIGGNDGSTIRSTIDPNTRPGFRLAERGASAKYPVVMVPGFITSGLELWSGEECAKRHFRQRLWGSLPIFVQSFFTDRQCWQRHLALDPLTGGDPRSREGGTGEGEGGRGSGGGKGRIKIKLRSAQGFEAADYFMSTYWVWDKLIQNLSDVGYDSSNMQLMSYDWRLSFPMLEERDGYLTKLKLNIEALVKTTGKPVALMSHSMGSQIVLYFFKWVTTPEEDGGGGGGDDWVEKNIYSFLNIAGPLLGVPKSVPALLSGEMKDTAVLMGPMGNVVERVFGRKLRKDLWSTWGSLWEMLPKGGDHIWGTSSDIATADDPIPTYHQRQRTSNSIPPLNDKVVCNAYANITNTCPNNSVDRQPPMRAPFITFTEDIVAAKTVENDSDYELIPTKEQMDMEKFVQNYGKGDEWSVNDAIAFLKNWGGGYGSSLHGAKLASAQSEASSWNDPTLIPLPIAPSMKIFCLYGVGIETERSYFYRRVVPSPEDLHHGAASDSQNGDGQHHLPLQNGHLPFTMDTTVSNHQKHIKFGTRFSDGDVSVPLVSLGIMCVDKWKSSSHLNPSNIDVVTREYAHREEFQVNDPMRGGPHSSDHVDILGNVDATLDVLKIVTDFDTDSLDDQIVSDIYNIAQKLRSRE